jgi:mRNA degradation ribonuclease J1/J2
VAFSAQNIDRLVTVFKAARQARRELVLDLYA